MAYVVGQGVKNTRYAWIHAPSLGDEDVRIRVRTSIPMGIMWGLSLSEPQSVRAFMKETISEWEGVEDEDGNIIPFSIEILDGEPSGVVSQLFLDIIRGIGTPPEQSNETS